MAKVTNSFIGRYGFRENVSSHGTHYSCPECDSTDVWIELDTYNRLGQTTVATCGRCGHQGGGSFAFRRLAVKIPLRRTAS